MMTLYDDEEILEMYTIDIKREAAEKYDRETRKTVENMIADGVSSEKIARYVPSLSLDEIKQIEAEVMQIV